jgi:hypothetical protein
MLILKSDLEDPYVPFVTSHHSKTYIHQIRHREERHSGSRRVIGRALVKAGLVVAGKHSR